MAITAKDVMELRKQTDCGMMECKKALTEADGNSALMLVCARLRHVAGTQWGGKKYMNMKHLEMQEDMAG